MPDLERVEGRSTIEDKLGQLAVVEADIAQDGLLQVLDTAEAVALQDVPDPSVEPLNHAIRLRAYRGCQAVLDAMIIAKMVELVVAGSDAAAQPEEPVGELLALVSQHPGDPHRRGAVQVAQKATSIRCRLPQVNAHEEAPVSVLTTAARILGRDFHWLITGKLEGQVDLYEQAVLATFECLEREGLPQPPKAVVAIARRALELALEKNTKPADEVPKLVQDSRYLLAS